MEWISVEDRLPEKEHGYFLVWNGKQVLQACNGDWFGDPYFSLLGLRTKICDVTHWMPLPEPPKEGD